MEKALVDQKVAVYPLGVYELAAQHERELAWVKACEAKAKEEQQQATTPPPSATQAFLNATRAKIERGEGAEPLDVAALRAARAAGNNDGYLVTSQTVFHDELIVLQTAQQPSSSQSLQMMDWMQRLPGCAISRLQSGPSGSTLLALTNA